MKEQELVQIEEAIAACNQMQVSNPIKDALVADLRPIAKRLPEYAAATKAPVSTQSEADSAELVCKAIADDVKLVKGQEVLSQITDGLHQLHRKFVGLRDMFLTPLENNRREIKGKIIRWQEVEAEKARALQRKLQAEADEKARLEREKMLNKMKSVKTPEKKEQYQATAAAVIAPTITIEAPRTTIKTSKRWAVKAINQDAFFGALVSDKQLRGYVNIKESSLVRTKAANPSMEIAGVEFEQRTV